MGPTLQIEVFAQQTKTGCRRGGAEDEAGGLIGAFRCDALCEGNGEMGVLVLDRHVHSESAKERISRDTLDVDVNACGAPATWFGAGLFDDRDELEVSGFDE
ncbi:hypothetical protein [Archangium violaceum]|uniref:hypothetical protein n=1 Tax=Archangium violaceum TaxID=83451 RepID=UPI001269D23F|nr:hypothetical protein [Archangium violaceum]